MRVKGYKVKKKNSPHFSEYYINTQANISGNSELVLVFNNTDKSKVWSYNYIIDDTYPEAITLKKELLKSLDYAVGRNVSYPYVKKILDDYPQDYITYYEKRN